MGRGIAQVRATAGHRVTVRDLDPELVDRLNILEGLREELGERFRSPQLLCRKMRVGKLGRKSGEGFYVWEDDERIAMSGDWDER